MATSPALPLLSWEALGKSLCPCASVSPSDKFRGREEVGQSDDLDLATRETEFWLCHPPMGSATSARSLDTSELHFSTEGHWSSASWPATQAWAWVPIALPLSHPPTSPSWWEMNQNRTCLYSVGGMGSVSISPRGERGRGKLQYQHGNYNWRCLIHQGG